MVRASAPRTGLFITREHPLVSAYTCGVSRQGLDSRTKSMGQNDNKRIDRGAKNQISGLDQTPQLSIDIVRLQEPLLEREY